MSIVSAIVAEFKLQLWLAPNVKFVVLKTGNRLSYYTVPRAPRLLVQPRFNENGLNPGMNRSRRGSSMLGFRKINRSLIHLHLHFDNVCSLVSVELQLAPHLSRARVSITFGGSHGGGLHVERSELTRLSHR